MTKNNRQNKTILQTATQTYAAQCWFSCNMHNPTLASFVSFENTVYLICSWNDAADFNDDVDGYGACK